MPRRILLLLPAAMALAAALSLGSRDAVEASCNPGRVDDNQTYSAGWFQIFTGQYGVGGVYSSIREYDPYVGSGPITENWSTAWSMLTIPDHTRWAQIGWLKKPPNFRYLFTQTTKSDGTIIMMLLNDTPPPIGAYTYYTVLYGNYAPGWITYQVNGVDRHYIYTGWTPLEGQTAGEITSLASQLPGGRLSPEYFKDTHMYYGGGWHDLDGIPTFFGPGASGYFGSVKQSSLQLKVWDKACTT